MAAASGVIGALILTQVMHRAQAGLVSITVEPPAPTLFRALWDGAIGGVIVVAIVPMLDKFRIDDLIRAIPVYISASI